MNNLRLACVSIFVLLSTACAGVAPPASPPNTTWHARSSVTVLAELPMTMSVQGHRLGIPLVKASLNGHETLMIVDSGSTHTVMTRQFAARHGVRTSQTEQGVGHANESVAVQQAARVEFALGDWTSSLSDVLVTTGPQAFESLGIGGFLSPQNVFGGTMVVDGPGERLLVLQGDVTAVDHWLSERYRGFESVNLPRLSVYDARKVYVSTSLGGRGAVATELDTAGGTTEFAQAYVGPFTAEKVLGGGVSVSGASIEVSQLSDATLSLGSLCFERKSVHVRDNMGGGLQARLGSDVLSQVVLVLPSDKGLDVRMLRAKRL